MFERIKKLAAKRNMNVKELAIKLGFSQNYFYSLKNGVAIPSDKLSLVANYLGVSTDYLLGNTDKPSWATEKDVLDIERALQLNSTIVAYDGIELTDEEKEQVDAIIRGVLWKHLKNKK
nr:MAG TPA: repressor protein [Caudoviricetes sp.]